MPTEQERLDGERAMRHTPIRLLRDECLIRFDKPERMSAHKTLYIPEGAQRQPHELYEATVLAVGPGIRRKDNGKIRPVEARPGDKVLVYWLADAAAFPEFGPDCRVIGEEYIQAVLQ